MNINIISEKKNNYAADEPPPPTKSLKNLLMQGTFCSRQEPQSSNGTRSGTYGSFGFGLFAGSSETRNTKLSQLATYSCSHYMVFGFVLNISGPCYDSEGPELHSPFNPLSEGGDSCACKRYTWRFSNLAKQNQAGGGTSFLGLHELQY